MVDNGIKWKFYGRTDIPSTQQIESIGLCMKKESNSYIEVSQITKGIKTLAFDWRSWGKSSDSATLVVTAGSQTKSLEFKSTDTAPSDPFTFDINENVTSFKIEFDSDSGNKVARVIIDNIRWTNFK